MNPTPDTIKQAEEVYRKAITLPGKYPLMKWERDIIDAIALALQSAREEGAESVIRALENSSTFEYGIGKQTQTELLNACRAASERIKGKV